MVRLFAALAASVVPAAAKAEVPAPFGPWEVSGARLEIVEDAGGAVVGKLAAPGGPCNVALGTELLRGTLLDDSLSAQVRLCLLAPECGAEEGTALAVLLVARQLVGGVHSQRPCASAVRSLALHRPTEPPQPMRAPPPAARLARTEPPPSPRQIPPSRDEKRMAPKVQPVAQVAPGEIAGHPIGEDQAPRYDARAARKGDVRSIDRVLHEGKALLEAGRFERARERFHDALELDPARAEAYNGVGVTFYARGDLDEAAAWYKRALQAQPGFGDAYYNLGCAYALQGHREQALRFLRLAALNHYTELPQLQADPDLASLRASGDLAAIESLMVAERAQ
jgi:hypothetical protein